MFFFKIVFIFNCLLMVCMFIFLFLNVKEEVWVMIFKLFMVVRVLIIFLVMLLLKYLFLGLVFILIKGRIVMDLLDEDMGRWLFIFIMLY